MSKLPTVIIGATSDNTEKLPEILKKYGITDKDLIEELVKKVKNHRNGGEIVNILERMISYIGVNDSHAHRYDLYCMSRDLVQMNSPIWGEPYEHVIIDKFPTKTEEITVRDIEYELARLDDIKRQVQKVSIFVPWKCKVENALRYLREQCVIYSFALEDIYDDIENKDKEAMDTMDYDATIKVIKIL